MQTFPNILRNVKINQRERYRKRKEYVQLYSRLSIFPLQEKRLKNTMLWI